MDNKFTYTYSAKQNAEVEAIRKKYTVQSESDNKLEQLKRLDRQCERPGKILSILVGILGTALLSYGMVSIFGSQSYGIGIPFTMIGLIIMAAAVPVFSIITEKRRKQIAPEILRLSEEIMKS